MEMARKRLRNPFKTICISKKEIHLNTLIKFKNIAKVQQHLHTNTQNPILSRKSRQFCVIVCFRLQSPRSQRYPKTPLGYRLVVAIFAGCIHQDKYFGEPAHRRLYPSVCARLCSCRTSFSLLADFNFSSSFPLFFPNKKQILSKHHAFLPSLQPHPPSSEKRKEEEKIPLSTPPHIPSKPPPA